MTHTYDQSKSGSQTPHFVVFFDNGLAAVCNAAGEQLTQYQKGNHDEVIAKLKADGYDWKGLVSSGKKKFSNPKAKIKLLDKNLRKIQEQIKNNNA